MDCQELLRSCRLCLLQGDDLFDIFVTQSVLQMLMDIMPFKITQTDGLPRRICQICLDRLELSHSFKHQALASHNKLCGLLNVHISCEGSIKIEPEMKAKEQFLRELENFQCESVDSKSEDYIIHSESEDLAHEIKRSKLKETKKIKSKTKNKSKEKTKLKYNSEKDLNPIKIEQSAYIVEHDKTEKNDAEKTGDLSGSDDRQVCRYCSKKFIDNKEMKEHYKFHRNEVLTCDTCNKSFAGRSLLHQHQNIHSKVPCEFCGMIMAKCYIRKHVQARHKSWKKECPICHAVLTGRDYFRVHVKRHTVRKTFKCGICKREFESQQGCDAHVRGHSNVRPYKCRYCDQTFTIHKTRNDHECLHTGARPYECPLCDKTFIQKSNWKSHFVHNHRDHEYKDWSRKVIFKSVTKTKEQLGI